MNCEIIAVGDEVLTGDIVNTNAREIAAGLEDAGVRVRRQTVTSDNPAEIRQTLAEAFDRSDVILTIGGLGPTYDDITRESAAEQMGVPLVRDPETERRIREYFTATGRELTDNNWRQAMIPEGGEALVNLNGTAPGIWLEKDGKILIQLPGPPRECLPIFRESVLPRLRERTGQKRVTRSVRIFGIPEAAAESRLHDRMTASRNPVIAPYVKDGEVEIRLRAWADTEEAAYALTEAPAREIAAEFGDHAYSLNGESLSEVLVRTLRETGSMPPPRKAAPAVWSPLPSPRLPGHRRCLTAACAAMPTPSRPVCWAFRRRPSGSTALYPKPVPLKWRGVSGNSWELTLPYRSPVLPDRAAALRKSRWAPSASASPPPTGNTPSPGTTAPRAAVSGSRTGPGPLWKPSSSCSLPPADWERNSNPYAFLEPLISAGAAAGLSASGREVLSCIPKHSNISMKKGCSILP